MNQNQVISVVYKNDSLRVFKNNAGSKKGSSKELEWSKFYFYTFTESELEKYFDDLELVADYVERFILKNSTKILEVRLYKGKLRESNKPYLIVCITNQLVNEFITAFYPINNKLFEKLTSDNIRIVI